MFGWEFPPFNSGGLGTACEGLTKALSAKGTEVVFVLPKKVDINLNYAKLVFGDNKNSFYVVNSLLKSYLNPDSYAHEFFMNNHPGDYGVSLMEEVERYGRIAAEIALNENFDVIHAHDWLTFKAGIAAKNATGKKLVVHIHATEFDRTGGQGNNQQVYNIEREGMHAADLVIAVSNFTKNKIVENYGVSPEKIRVVHNSVDFENYELSRISKLKENNKIVLYLGRLTIQKGPDYFIYSAKRVLEKYPNVIFVVAGSGDMEKFLINKTAELGISDRVIFTGFLRGEDLQKAYKMADLYVMPSVSEPFGITPLESLMSGTPVIISKQSGVSEILTHCLKVDFWDVDELSNKIISVLRHNELYSTLRENGFKEAQSVKWENSAEKTIGVYNELLGVV